MIDTIPLCAAPFNSVCIHPNKRVTPCCAFTGGLGNLNDTPLDKILKGPELLQLQEDMRNKIWNPGCLSCKRSEENAGRSARLDIAEYRQYDSSRSLTFFENNSSNTCNLVCYMCNPSFSSLWSEFDKEWNWLDKLKDPVSDVSGISWKIHPADVEFAEESLSKIDFSKLQKIMLKGGEPFLNKENIVLLRHLENIGRLDKIAIMLNTNATYINHQMLELLKKAKNVGFMISIDGPDSLNRWLRWGYKNPEISSVENLLNNIKVFLEMPNFKFLGNTFAIGAYSIYRLEEFRKWWDSTVWTLDKMNISKAKFNFFVNNTPGIVSALSPNTREKLAQKYELLDSEFYSTVINYLKNEPYVGDDLHDKFVESTFKLDKTRDTSITDIIPEIKEELVYLTA
jgi:radical SAM protein with 4Fe4S-binding SPASM domain